MVALAKLIADVKATKLAVEEAEAELCDAQRLLPVKEAEISALDARNSTMVSEVIRPFRDMFEDRYRAAGELRTGRNL